MKPTPILARARLLYPVLLVALVTACAAPPERPAATSAAAPHPVVQETLIPGAAHEPALPVAPEPPFVAALPRADANAPLAEVIDRFLAQRAFRHATWSVRVVELANGQVRYAHNADKLLVPASNAKLYTAAVALANLGTDARFTTTLLTTATGRGGAMLNGDLIVRGGGDPSLGNAAVALHSADWTDGFAAAVAELGVTAISGDLVADVSLFRGPPYGGGWEAGDLEASWAPPVSALSSDGNRIALTVRRQSGACCAVDVDPAVLSDDVLNLTGARSEAGDGPLMLLREPGEHRIRVIGSLPPGSTARRFAQAAPEPPRLALLRLRQALAERGIRVNGRVRVARWPHPASKRPRRETVLARIQSPPLAHLVHHMLKKSDNAFAQTLLLQVGVQAAATGTCSDRSRAPVTTEDWGLCAMRAMLRQAGIDRAMATFSEGSGLSRHDLVSTTATTRLLRWVHQQPFAAAFQAALPVAGVDGTLRWRLRDLPEGTDIHAKTGTLSHVYALAGYATDAAGQPLVFAITLNHYQRPRDANGQPLAPPAHAELDHIAGMIIRHANASTSTPAARVAPAAVGVPPAG